jgi:hypothetical protein
MVVETNKATGGKSTTSTDGKAEVTRKLAISVFKRDGNQLANIGNFTTATKACEYINSHKLYASELVYAGTSATRVLRDAGFIVEKYDGNSFLA